MAKIKINIAPSMKKLDLVVKGFSNSKFMGNYASVFKGHGLEFADFRTYTQNDDASMIDWKTSARSDKTLVKEYVEERNIDIFFLVDVSSKMMLGSVSKLKSEYIADFIASMVYTILTSGDRVGIAMFSDKIQKVIYPENGIKHFYSISHALSDLTLYGGESNIKNAVELPFNFLGKGSIVFLVSDFLTEENLELTLRIAGHKFDMIAVIVRDPLDLEIPNGIGQVMIQDPVSGERVLVSPNKVSNFYSQEAKAQLNNIKRQLEKSNVDFLEFNTKFPFIKKLIEFFELRKKKWR
jgi:uncharacterized protein (DUF58 family)